MPGKAVVTVWKACCCRCLTCGPAAALHSLLTVCSHPALLPAQRLSTPPAPPPFPLQAASAPQLFQVQQIAAALVGFLCYKAAVVGVAIIPPPMDDERSLLAQADAGGNGGKGSHD